MTIAARKNLAMDQGATFIMTVRYKDSAGTPIDLAGWTGKFTIKQRGTGTVIKETTADLSPIGTAVGYVVVEIPDEETALIDAKTFAYTLEITNTEGEIYRLLFGSLDVRSGFNV